MENILKTQNNTEFCRRGKYKTYFKALSITFFLSLIVILTSISMVSAEFDWNTNLSAYWSFNEGSGIIAADSSNNSRNGILNNTLWTTEGIIGTATSYDGINTYINVSKKIVYERTDSFSLSFWMNTSVDGNLQTVFFAGSAGGFDTGWHVRLDGTDKLEFHMNGAVDSFSVETTNVIGSNNRWKHVVIVYNGSSQAAQVLFYINGSVVAKTGIGSVTSSLVSGSNKNVIGAKHEGLSVPFNGSLDEIALFQRVLNTSEVAELYNGGAGLSFTTNIDVNLLTPADSTTFSSTEVNFNISMTPSLLNLTNATIYIWNSTRGIFNRTVNNVSGKVINYTNWNITGFVIGNYEWNVQSCGVNNSLDSLCFWSDTNNSFEVSVNINSTSFNTSVFETQSSLFSVDLIMIPGVNLFSASLNYNGTRYLGSIINLGGDTYRVSRTIDIPLLKNPYAGANKTFLWEIEYRNGFEGNQTTAVQSHLVKPLVFTNCNATYPNHFVNFTVYNETSRSLINTLMDATFTFWKGSGTIMKNYSINSAIVQTNYTFCSNQNETINVSAIIEINAPFFKQRTFNFNKVRYNNITTEVNLFLLDIGSNIITETTDAGLAALEGVFLNIYRYYPEINKYLIVERLISDEFGQSAARLVERTVAYQFEFKDANNKLLKRTNDLNIICRTTICVVQSVIEDTTQDFDRFINLTDFTGTLDFNNNTNIFTYTWNDATGDSINNVLLVKRTSLNSSEIVCNVSSVLSSGSLICAVGDSKSSYSAQAFRIFDGEQRRIFVLSVRVGDDFGTFGREGLIWVFLILFTLIGVGSFSPSIGSLLYLIGFTMFGIMGLISFNITILFANIVICVLFIWAFET